MGKSVSFFGSYYIVQFTDLTAIRNAAGHTKKIVTTAVLFVAQCVGNVIMIYITLLDEY